MRLILIILLSFQFITHAQNEIQNLKNELETTSEPTRQIELKIAIADRIGYNDTEASVKYGKEAYQQAQELNNEELIVESGVSLISNAAMASDFELATEVAFNILEIAENSDEISNGPVYNILGLLYQRREEYDMSRKYFEKATLAYDPLKDSAALATSYNNLANAYNYVGEHQKAIELHKKAYEIRLGIGNKAAIADCLNDMGVDYLHMGDTAEAINKFTACYNLKKEIGDLEGMSFSKANIGVIYKRRKQNENAAEAFNEVINISKEIGAIGMLMDINKMLSSVYEESNQYDSALIAYRTYTLYKDSIQGLAKEKAILDMETKYESNKKQLENDHLKKENREKDKRLDAEQTSKQLLWAAIILIGITVVVVVIYAIGKVRSNKQISMQKKEVEYQKDIVQAKNNEIMDSISYAKRIQSAILPPNKLVKEYLANSFVLYKPKDIVAGDFYWLEPTNDSILFAAADCTGHGVPGAMVSVVCNNGLNRSVREYGLSDPGKILDKTREIVISEFEKSEEEVKDGMDVALCSLEGNTLKYAGAHNPLWIIRKDAQEVEEIKANKQPIGKYDEPLPYTTHTVELSAGDSFYIFSDGYADQFGGEKGKKFKAANFKRLLLSIQSETMERQRELIDEAFEKWKGTLEQLDDVCVIGVRM